ncbi:hypothetical protein CROQUDRAFT_294575 [Cronartium quercuum f. sp. fusiforme G11]|uniref:Transmembrane protein n=1 Tax=Cronartium quercuum f. sp. fusiforme G11 TaxID=708437 RepID=A0A9P6T799_9BASI|nr:hypothetical protein CROQUDRAFT_294575 [Cronartium quercuum f. sp. fusiforme G11]
MTMSFSVKMFFFFFKKKKMNSERLGLENLVKDLSKKGRGGRGLETKSKSSRVLLYPQCYSYFVRLVNFGLKVCHQRFFFFFFFFVFLLDTDPICLLLNIYMKQRWMVPVGMLDFELYR